MARSIRGEDENSFVYRKSNGLKHRCEGVSEGMSEAERARRLLFLKYGN